MRQTTCNPNPSNSGFRDLAISMGDPAGIGAEVTLKALALPEARDLQPVLVGCRRWLETTYQGLKGRSGDPLRDPAELEVLDLPLPERVRSGATTPASGEAGFQWLTAATKLVQQGKAGALVTAPIAKASWHAAGHLYPGQTERLAELAGVKEASMLFTARSPHGGWRLNTLLATTHIPLAAVCDQLTGHVLQRKLDHLLDFCLRFNPKPRLTVAGLNPHAGESGRLGLEEQTWLNEALASWRQQHRGVDVVGPAPPDTCWLSAASAWNGNPGGSDGYLALYHDQGLIPVKLLAFDAAVNTTLGLPFLRTSPDHGTGCDIAGEGVARPTSMAAAIATAMDLG